MNDSIREPKQKRAIEKKEKIIEVGFKMICENGYHNINTAEIAKNAGVSTGIVYQYFKDKYDILIEGLEKYGDSIFFPLLNNQDIKFEKNDFSKFLDNMISYYVNNHKVSNIAHEEIMSMVHSDKRVAEYYYHREIEMTNSIKNILLDNGFKDNNLYEKTHIMIGLIDNLCHEVIYHKHIDMNYDIMKKLVIDTINNLFKEDLK
ncbi:MAG: TetR/AcrR family transcriptional regulator [Bacilli bacterium]|nr:TetR/AcrR family transcriptional regulator [Bacilli bacterium]